VTFNPPGIVNTPNTLLYVAVLFSEEVVSESKPELLLNNKDLF